MNFRTKRDAIKYYLGAETEHQRIKTAAYKPFSCTRIALSKTMQSTARFSVVSWLLKYRDRHSVWCIDFGAWISLWAMKLTMCNCDLAKVIRESWNQIPSKFILFRIFVLGKRGGLLKHMDALILPSPVERQFPLFLPQTEKENSSKFSPF